MRELRQHGRLSADDFHASKSATEKTDWVGRSICTQAYTQIRYVCTDGDDPAAAVYEHRKEEWTSRRIGYVIFLVATIALALPFVYIRQLTEANAAYYLVGVMGGLLLMIFYWFGYRLVRHKPVVAAKIQGRDAIIKNIPIELQDALPLA